MNPPLFYEQMTVPQLRKFKNDNAVILLSFGSVEQHSTHLPVGTDSLCSLRRVEAIASRTGSLVLAPLSLGYSFNHKGMFGTISLKAETMLHIVTEILEQLCSQDWKRFIIFSGHAGNWNILDLAVQISREKYPHSQFIVARGIPSPPDFEQNKQRFVKHFDFHAGKVETAIVSYYFPELVDQENIPLGNTALPISLLKHIHSSQTDYMDEILIRACTPQKTELLSTSGNWGIQNPHDYRDVPVEEAMRRYEDFFVELISRWNLWE